MAFTRLRQRHRTKINNYRPTYMTMAALIIDAAEERFTGIRWSKDDLLDCLILIRGLHSLLDRKEAAIMTKARARGVPFNQIAQALGVSSRQAAEQRLLALQAGKTEGEAAWLDKRRRDRLGMEWSPHEIDRWWLNTVMVGIFDHYPEELGDSSTPDSPEDSSPRSGESDG
jgi:hypothetical protein